MFSEIWNRQPREYEPHLWLFGNEQDGDYFDEEDFLIWQNDLFEHNFSTDRFLNNDASEKLIDEIVRNREPYVDLACGPGMGLIPSVKKKCSEIPCLATDANARLIKELKKWLREKKTETGIEFAQFSLFDIPVADCAVNAYGGFLPISSTRNGNSGYDCALSEIFRTLATKGRLYAIESELLDVPAILKVFEMSGMHPWSCFSEEQKTWHDRFINHGFKILYEEPYLKHRLNEDDNELGRAAEKLGVQIEMQWNAFIAEKP
ncbi:MAG: hypothetical protein J5816_04475 [Clostridia bacterium]|nr:hypothetical protein [Clostridia bacterium]